MANSLVQAGCPWPGRYAGDDVRRARFATSRSGFSDAGCPQRAGSALCPVTDAGTVPARRPGEMTAVAEGSAPTYLQLLEEAQELGRMDGRFAAAFEAPGRAVSDGTRCLGRTPEEFAVLLWEGLPGTPPS